MKAVTSLNRPIRILGIVALSLWLIVFVLAVIKEFWSTRRQQNETQAVINEIEDGNSTITISSVLPEIEGEEQDLLALRGLEELLGVTFANQQDLDEAQALAGTYKLEAVGVLEIPAIELKLPVMNGTGTVGLRYGAGWFSSSADLGGAGSCLLFGHRMEAKGRLFNRFGELEPGNEVHLSDMEGNKFTYTVVEILEVKPEALFEELYKRAGGRNLAMITCTPIGVASHRMIVWCEIK